MVLSGVNHVAILTDRLHELYREVFDAAPPPR